LPTSPSHYFDSSRAGPLLDSLRHYFTGTGLVHRPPHRLATSLARGAAPPRAPLTRCFTARGAGPLPASPRHYFTDSRAGPSPTSPTHCFIGSGDCTAVQPADLLLHQLRARLLPTLLTHRFVSSGAVPLPASSRHYFSGSRARPSPTTPTRCFIDSGGCTAMHPTSLLLCWLRGCYPPCRITTSTARELGRFPPR
jgi:hypothetical protein